MSIINDALKKAEQEGKSKSQPSFSLLKKEIPQNKYHKFKNVLPLISIITVILASAFLYYNIPQKKTSSREVKSEKNKPRTLKGTGAQTGTSTLKGLSILSRLSKPAVISGKTASKGGFSLNGIVFSEGRSWAVINDDIVREGDTIKGARLVKIEKNSVELALPNKKLILKLKN